ncbi:hypothetical protein ACI79D_10950 [Geodermatophilus sp. SYSU D00708]
MRQDPASNPPPVVPGEGAARPAAHGWAGWVVFAGVVLVLLGGFHVIEGLVALAGGGAGGRLPVTDPAVWGWGHVALGVLAALVGLGLLAGAAVARVLGVVLALLSAVATFASSGASPVGSAVVIAVDAVVVYAITVHGGELRSPSYR